MTSVFGEATHVMAHSDLNPFPVQPEIEHLRSISET